MLVMPLGHVVFPGAKPHVHDPIDLFDRPPRFLRRFNSLDLEPDMAIVRKLHWPKRLKGPVPVDGVDRCHASTSTSSAPAPAFQKTRITFTAILPLALPENEST
jgi:hypothetical protein